MKNKLIALSAVTALTGALALPALAQNVAIVNGVKIPESRVTMIKARLEEQAALSGGQLPPQIDQQLREEVITREIMAQEAQRRGLDKTDDFKAKAELSREGVLINELLEDFRKNNPVTDEEAKAEYDRIVASQAEAAKGTEYRARHILVETEEKAKALIARIKGGEDFAEVAEAESKDPGSGANGGDLGWATPETYVPEFSEAMTKLEKGVMTDEPVQSQFGYHIIQLDDTRDQKAPEPPKFEDVKDQVKQSLEQQKQAEFQQELRAAAKVE